MLALLAFVMVATFMTLIMTKRLSALIALILIPTLFAIGAGFSAGLGDMMLQGIRELAPTGVMLLFAILYFGLMIDVGLFDPLVRLIVRLVHGDPMRILIGTVALALTVSLDGDGTTTYMITVSALLPLYKHMKMDLRMLTCLLIMSSAVMNIAPWGGPTVRAATALHVDPRELFVALIPAMMTTGVWTFFVAWIFGRRERRRLAELALEIGSDEAIAQEVIEEEMGGDTSMRRPKLFWVNLVLTLALLAMLIAGSLPLPVLFMLAFAIAAMINYPRLQEQKERISAHAGNALGTVSLIFAAGIFTGILSGTKMVDAMAASVTNIIPASLGPYMAPITALVSIPFTVLISNDAFYFGMLPVLGQTGMHYGLTPMELARASLIGQQIHLLSPLVASTYLLVGLAGVDLGDHQRFTFRWALGSCAVFMVTCLLLGVFPLRAG
ncbi:MAG: citN [Sphingomonas bacterium]|jgi:CitMHS family citrate-Mg2+:H+ or citrate-Ca2+:H+ symporter|uniref:CitMHS family transporter n=1 Tax=Sphingomonas bacterium TaxID=1895847 RepID=UPI002610A8B7|nr:citrate:proton symporter [Sphingomonas bacterium]MDB5705553.1 citN [Sphingomonas bacterium]